MKPEVIVLGKNSEQGSIYLFSAIEKGKINEDVQIGLILDGFGYRT